MRETTFEDRPLGLAGRVTLPPPAQRYTGVCRGSAHPEAVTWLAERLGLEPGRTVVDLGAGLGEPEGWFARRSGCRVLEVEPVPRSPRSPSEGLGHPVLVGATDRVPLADDAADAVLLLGVLSVLGEFARAALQEARRLAPALGVLDYCATGGATVFVGGNRFRPAGAVRAELAVTGWSIAALRHTLPPAAAAEPPVPPGEGGPNAGAEHDILDAIERGDLAPLLLVARRVGGLGH